MTKPSLRKKMTTLRRKSLNASTENLIKTSYFQPDQTLPLIVEPAIKGVDLLSWAQNHRLFIEENVLKHGGVLFRGFAIDGVAQFEQFITVVSDSALTYQERSSPRSQVAGNIYTSTEHPADQTIFLHNEQSYNLTFPLRIFFFCETPAQEGGRTPICDSREIFKRLDPQIKQRFMDKNYMYVRNFGDGFGLSWQTAFQTDSKAQVEAYCRKNNLEYEWKEDNRLRTRQIRRVVASHPRSGEMSWFNHVTFFHVSTLEQKTQERLLTIFDEDELPNNTYYGDGTPIEPEVLDVLREAYKTEMVSFPWQKGDLLMLDNMLVAHAREPYKGPRKILAGMSEPWHWDKV